jgi:hypothetical protein
MTTLIGRYEDIKNTDDVDFARCIGARVLGYTTVKSEQSLDVEIAKRTCRRTPAQPRLNASALS